MNILVPNSLVISITYLIVSQQDKFLEVQLLFQNISICLKYCFQIGHKKGYTNLHTPFCFDLHTLNIILKSICFKMGTKVNFKANVCLLLNIFNF